MCIRDSCYQEAKKILQSNKGLLTAIANKLLEQETIDSSEVQKLALNY